MDINKIENEIEKLNKIVEDEMKIIHNLVPKISVFFAGNWNFSVYENDPDFRKCLLKLKTKEGYVLVESSCIDKNNKVHLDISLCKMDVKPIYKNGPDRFKNILIAEGWGNVRNHVSLNELITLISNELKQKMKNTLEEDKKRAKNLGADSI